MGGGRHLTPTPYPVRPGRSHGVIENAALCWFPCLLFSIKRVCRESLRFKEATTDPRAMEELEEVRNPVLQLEPPPSPVHRVSERPQALPVGLGSRAGLLPTGSWGCAVFPGTTCPCPERRLGRLLAACLS